METSNKEKHIKEHTQQGLFVSINNQKLFIFFVLCSLCLCANLTKIIFIAAEFVSYTISTCMLYVKLSS